MSCAAQVAAFLSPLHPAWDLSLMFVMGGALLVALPGEGGGVNQWLSFHFRLFFCSEDNADSSSVCSVQHARPPIQLFQPC